MTTRYCGTGGNDANDGLSWANRKLTLNGVEDTPVASGDVVYVGPGVYREVLTVDVSGASEIAYIADVTGEHTDGVGGVVRVTGSDNDTAGARNNCIVASSKNYRTFRGFTFDLSLQHTINGTSCANWVIEDCNFQAVDASANYDYINCNGASQASWTIWRCRFLYPINFRWGVRFEHSATVDNAGHLVENCLVIGTTGGGVGCSRVGGITVKNCTFIGGEYAVRVDTALTAGQTVTINNSIFINHQTAALRATAVGELVEDYNSFWRNIADRTNVNIGANSVAYPPLFDMSILLSGIKFPGQFGELSQWSQVREFSGINVPSNDLFGLLRPTLGLYGWVNASLGAIQYQDIARATNNVRTGTASLLMTDSARHQIFVPIAAESTIFSVYVYREASYTGNNPQMIIKQPGQSNRFAIDVGPAGQWNNLSITFTPAALPPYVVVELVSENQQENSIYGGNYDVYWDDLTVT